ncbi:MAG: YbdK family carboxylate-amine ligase [Solirubrobacterales bacterium]|nr:YbdK family carboxylate-amine ligase [Solirubrobacterales bacterium]
MLTGLILPGLRPNDPTADSPESARALGEAFESATSYTVGIEDELMVLDPQSYELLPCAAELLRELEGDWRFKLELPASQLEILTSASLDVQEIGRELLESRRELAGALDRRALLAAAGVHPHSPGVGELNRLERYTPTIDEYGLIAERQLVCALQVHVAVGDPALALTVYNAVRSELPALAALAANAPFYEGRDTGFASVRPLLAGMLPRQGVPPALESWEEYAEALRWGAASGSFEKRTWWWELRLHPGYGTLEFRVPDAQSSVGEATAIAAVIQALVATLGERAAAGEQLLVAPRWRIEENRWAACRRGVEGSMLDLQSGERRATRDYLHELVDNIAAAGERLGSTPALERARRMINENGAIGQRRAAAQGGANSVIRWLAGRLLEGLEG